LSKKCAQKVLHFHKRKRILAGRFPRIWYERNQTKILKTKQKQKRQQMKKQALSQGLLF